MTYAEAVNISRQTGAIYLVTTCKGGKQGVYNDTQVAEALAVLRSVQPLVEAVDALRMGADLDRSILTIEGIHYTFELFKELGMSGMGVGQIFRIISRDNDTVAIERLPTIAVKAKEKANG